MLDGWIYLYMDGWIYIYLCIYGRPEVHLFFPWVERWHGHDKDRKMRPLLPNMMLRNNNICAMKSVSGRTTENTGCHEDS
jgi:acylphosphatase